MLEDIKSGKINCIIVKDLSRLGREYNETFTYLRRVFPALGVRFIAINDNIDTAKETVTGDISVSFKGVMNDEYCRDISVKVRTALNIKRKNGDFVGAVPVYGYKKADDNKNQLVIDEYAAQVVKDIFKMRTDGYSAERNLQPNLTGLRFYRRWNIKRTIISHSPQAATATRKIQNGRQQP